MTPKVKATCAAEFMSYVNCMEKSSGDMQFYECRKTQGVYDKCVQEKMGLERPHYGYHSLPKIHDTDRPAPVKQKPGWMDNDKAKKLAELPANFPRTTSTGAALVSTMRTRERFNVPPPAPLSVAWCSVLVR